MEPVRGAEAAREAEAEEAGESFRGAQMPPTTPTCRADPGHIGIGVTRMIGWGGDFGWRLLEGSRARKKVELQLRNKSSSTASGC